MTVQNRVHQLDVTDQELAYCYRKAGAFIFPSLYEGFGIPILESLASGCPAILSNRSCFPEIAEGAAAYFDPDTGGFARQSIIQVLSDKSYRNRLIAMGATRVRNFTWEKVAAETAAIYRTVI